MNNQFIKFTFIFLLSICSSSLYAQYLKKESKYIGIKPKTDYNPYQSSTTLLVNVVPIVFEYRIEENVGIQIRPILDYTFGGGKAQLSDFGLSLAGINYFSDAIKRDYWIKPNLAVALTYNYNKLSKFNSIALSLEPGISFLVNPNFLISAGINPSIGYFIGKNGRAAAGNSTGLNVGWGVFVHLGYNWFSVLY